MKLNVHYLTEDDVFHIVDGDNDEAFPAKPLYRNGKRLEEADAAVTIARKYSVLNDPDFSMLVWQEFDERMQHSRTPYCMFRRVTV